MNPTQCLTGQRYQGLEADFERHRVGNSVYDLNLGMYVHIVHSFSQEIFIGS